MSCNSDENLKEEPKERLEFYLSNEIQLIVRSITTIIMQYMRTYCRGNRISLITFGIKSAKKEFTFISRTIAYNDFRTNEESIIITLTTIKYRRFYTLSVIIKIDE